jgi:hypothetical protein
MGSADNTKQLLKEFVARESAATSINSAAKMGQLPDCRDAWFTQSAAGGYTIVCPKITFEELRAGAREGFQLVTGRRGSWRQLPLRRLKLKIGSTETACRLLCPNASPRRAHPTNDPPGRHSICKCSNP